MSNATAPGTPPPEPTTAPEPAAPPTPTAPAGRSGKGATIGERLAAKRSQILSRPAAAQVVDNHGEVADESDAGTGGGTDRTKTNGKPQRPVQTAPATEQPDAANDNQTPEDEAREAKKLADEQRLADLRSEKAQRRKVVQEAISLRSEKRKLRQMRTDQEARENRLKAAETERAELEDLRRKDPVAYARRSGFSLREIAERELQDEKAKPKVPLEDLPEEVRAEIEEGRKWREEQARKEKEREEREAEAERKHRAAEGSSQGQRRIAAIFSEEAADYPHLQGYFEQETVVASAWQIMLDHWNEHEEELDLRKVFSYMEDNARKEREKFSKPLPPQGVPDRASREASQASHPEPTTMSQSDAASGAPVPTRKEKREEKKQRIMRRLSRG